MAATKAELISRITKLLGLYNYSVDTWTDLADIPLIALDQDGKAYTNKNQMRFYFPSNKDYAIFVYGSYKSDGKFYEFLTDSADEGTWLANGGKSYLAYSMIAGFIESVYISGDGLFYQR